MASFFSFFCQKWQQKKKTKKTEEQSKKKKNTFGNNDFGIWVIMLI